MQKHALMLATALLGVGALTACGGSKSTAPSKITYTATLTGAGERPTPITTTATGTWTGVLDPQTNTMTYTLTYTGLSANSTGAHIHAQADANTSASVVLNFQSFTGATTPFTSGSTSGTATGTVNMAGPAIPPSFTISGDSLRKAMDAGMAYVNVHSSAHQGGEIRGQIVRQQ
jgi:CHRD domain